ncbi:MAG: hypothetical protein E6J65_11220 [Deltaproteobacteria bacterium]|nr:MAG: hypothetical protein E6J65_11220 [Deltaproteobacteria bacterium]
MPLLAILLVAAAPGQDVVQLTSKTQLKELCEALRAQPSETDLDPAQIAEARKAAQARREEAAGRWYRVEVPSKGFAFGRYRAQDQQLELDGDRPLRAIDDTLSLDLDGIDDVSFAAGSEQVTAWTQEKKAKALKLVLVWKPSGARCAGSAAAEAWRIAGHARSWELLGAQGTLASANEEGDPVGAGPRQMRVEKVTLDSDDAPLENEGRSRLASSQAALDRCAAGAVRTGRLVMSFSVHDGRVREPQVIMDSLRDEKIAGCVARAISGTELAGTGHGTASLTVQ